jgi:hypothetical protein
MSFSGDQWGRPQQQPPPDQSTSERRSRGPLGCYLVVVAFFAVCTVISFAVSSPTTGYFMAYLFLALTVLLAISGFLIRNISHAMRRKE